MPSFCGIINCGNRGDRDKVSFFRLPVIPKKGKDSRISLISERRKKWLIAINRSDLTEEKMTWLKVCQEHFVTGKPAHLEDVQHTDWVPSKNLGYGKDISATSYSRYQRSIKRSKVPLSSGTIVSNLSDGAVASLVAEAGALDDDAVAALDAEAVAPLDAEAFASDAEAVAALDTEAVASFDADAVATLDAEAVAALDAEAGSFLDAGAVAAFDGDAGIPLDDDAVAPLDEGAVIVLRDNTKRGKTISVQTETTMHDLRVLEHSYDAAVSELTEVKERLKKMSLSEDDFAKNDKKTRYYSGLANYQVFIILFQHCIAPYLNVTATSALSKFQQFMLTLMHLRLNLDFTDLGYRFGIDTCTASRIFSNCLWIMHKRTSKLLMWPEREALISKMPAVFTEAFGHKVTVIIDCFEIFIQKPPNVLAAAQTFSNYKHHNTIKYLIGVSPQGVITYLSSGWGGRASDKYIVQNCGILEKLVPGDLILADRGFNVKDEVELYCAEIKVPSFTKGKKQLSPLDIENTRALAHVRIHVERVIGVLRQKYRILHNIMPISLIKKTTKDTPSTVDQIVSVCCCLTNLCPSVVPFD